MPKKAPELAAFQVKRLKKPGLHAVGGVAGLHLYIKPSTNTRSWVLRVKVGNRRPDIGLGGYPDVTLEQARQKAREIRDQIARGIDPLEARRAAQAALRVEEAKRLTFAEAAAACWRAKSPEFRNVKHATQWKSTLDAYAVPVIGELPVGDVELAHVVKVLEPIWKTKTETANRLRGRIENVIAWATVSGHRSGDNPARWRGNLEYALPRPTKVHQVVHHPAIPWQEIGQFVSDLRLREGMGARALEFAILTAARSGEVRLATWEEFDLKAKLWTVPGSRMKAGRPHRVPLSDVAVELLAALPKVDGSRYVFAAVRGGALSDMSLSAVTRRMGVQAVPHGFRSTFKDWARSCTAFPDEVTELALAHVNSDATRAAYARDELLPKRAQLMAAWAKHLAKMPTKAAAVPIGKARRDE